MRVPPAVRLSASPPTAEVIPEAVTVAVVQADGKTDGAQWKERFEAYRAGLKEGEKGYGSLYTYTYVQIYREMKG